MRYMKELSLIAAELVCQIGHNLLVSLHYHGILLGVASKHSLYYLFVFHRLNR